VTLFIAPESFSTREFTLRSYHRGDGAKLAAAARPSYEHLRPWMAWATGAETVEESEPLVRKFRAAWLLSSDFCIAITSRDDDVLLGGCGYHLREGPLETGRAEIGMWIAAARAGDGLGTKVLAALLEWGFTEWPWRRLSWKCDVSNHASRRVAEKNGLRLEGTFKRDEQRVDGSFRDTLYFAILKEEWEG
jgi:RimJ/RimL family protein N-acetyltransferase